MRYFDNRYVRLALLTLVLGLFFWAILWLILFALRLTDFPIGLQLALAFLGSGLLVAKYLSDRIF